MKRNHLCPRLAQVALLLVACAGVSACETEDPTTIVVDNAYPAGAPAAQTVVYRAWWVATYFPAPVAGDASSDVFRSIPSNDYAYALLAPGWDPASPTPPTRLLVVKSKAPLSVARGELLHVAISDATFAGNCTAQQALSQADADFITQSIFPGEFAGVRYDAKTCTTTPIDTAADGGVDGGAP